MSLFVVKQELTNLEYFYLIILKTFSFLRPNKQEIASSFLFFAKLQTWSSSNFFDNIAYEEFKLQTL